MVDLLQDIEIHMIVVGLFFFHFVSIVFFL